MTGNGWLQQSTRQHIVVYFLPFCRQNGIGIGSMCARIGGVLAPMMYLLRSISPQAPMVLCGLCPLLGSALTFLLPETANKHLPDTIEDVEGPNLRFDTRPLGPSFILALRSDGSADARTCDFSISSSEEDAGHP